MTRRLPILPTLVVAAAAATMVALGFWQLGRAREKAALIARYEQAIAMSSEMPWPSRPDTFENALYRRTTITCDRVLGVSARAGRSQEGRSGWMQIARCERDGGGLADVALGWSAEPQAPRWSGGQVQGQIAPAGRGVRLIAMPPVAGLDPLAAPAPQDLPNNHLAYAVQWFLFALTALVIYGLALRRKSGRADRSG